MSKIIEGEIENQEAIDITEELDAILDADFETPIEPRDRYRVNQKKTNLAYKYYLKIQPELREWWDEFNTSLDDRGNKKYRSVYQFVKVKAKTKVEQEYLMEMIGPRPQLKEGRQLRAPWLGDWMLRRSNGYWAPEQPEKIKSLARAVKTKLASWEAVRSAAPYLVQQMARLMRLEEQIDEAFGGQAFDLDKKPNDPENIARFNLIMEFRKKVSDQSMKLMDMWMQIHGVDPKNPVQMAQVNNLTQNINSAMGLMDPQGELTPMMKEIETFRVAKQLTAHAKNFNMPLPESLSPKHIPEEEPQKPNGKSKVQ